MTILVLRITFLSCGAARVRIEPESRDNFSYFDLSTEPTVVDPHELSSLEPIRSTNIT
jgi:hypothetical protein